MESKQDLPPGWKWMKLGEVIKLTQSGTWGDEPFEAPKEEIFTVIRSTEIDHKGVISIKDEKVAQRRVKTETARKYFLKPDDLLIVRSGGTTGKIILGRVGLYLGEPNKYLFSNFLLRIQVDENLVLPEFLWRYLNWDKFLEDNIPNLMRRTTGMQNLPMDEYFSIMIPFPPLSEQKRIAEKLKALMDEIDEARTSCEKQLEAAKSLPSAYLREVFESPEVQKWEKKKLGEVCEIFSGTSAPQDEKYFENGKYPFVRVSDLGKIRRTANLVEIKDYINDLCLKELNMVKASKGTIIFPKSGAAITTNNRAILGIDAYIVSHLAAVKPKENIAETFFVFYWLSLIDMVQYMDNIGYPSLKLSTISRIQIPLPPLPEQKRIAAYLKEKIDQAEKLRETLENELETINALPQSILSKAFRGEI